LELYETHVLIFLWQINGNAASNIAAVLEVATGTNSNIQRDDHNHRPIENASVAAKGSWLFHIIFQGKNLKISKQY